MRRRLPHGTVAPRRWLPDAKNKLEQTAEQPSGYRISLQLYPSQQPDGSIRVKLTFLNEGNFRVLVADRIDSHYNLGDDDSMDIAYDLPSELHIPELFFILPNIDPKRRIQNRYFQGDWVERTLDIPVKALPGPHSRRVWSPPSGVLVIDPTTQKIHRQEMTFKSEFRLEHGIPIKNDHYRVWRGWEEKSTTRFSSRSHSNSSKPGIYGFACSSRSQISACNS